MEKKYRTLVSWHYERKQGIRTTRKTDSRVLFLKSSKDAWETVAQLIKYKNRASERLVILSVDIVPENFKTNG